MAFKDFAFSYPYVISSWGWDTKGWGVDFEVIRGVRTNK